MNREKLLQVAVTKLGKGFLCDLCVSKCSPLPSGSLSDVDSAMRPRALYDGFDWAGTFAVEVEAPSAASPPEADELVGAGRASGIERFEGAV